MATPSLAREFFESIRSDPLPFIRSLPSAKPPTFETDWLDFKQEPQPPALDNPKWREMWVEAVGGFANNQGGVIVWGVDARKDPTTNIDAASSLKPIANPLGVKSRLTELLRQATDPPILNVEIDAYEDTSGGKGFVVCHIPEGTHKPYRSEYGNRSQYHIRAGDQFVVMSRSMLGAMFWPKSKPIILAVADVVWQPTKNNAVGNGNIYRILWRISLVNTGTATAREIYCSAKWDMPGRPEDRSAPGGAAMLNSDREYQFIYGSPIHPGPTIRRPCFNASWQLQYKQGEEYTRHKLPAPTITMSIHCENQEPQIVVLELDMDKLFRHENQTVESTAVASF